MNSREIDDLTRHLCQAVGDRVDDIAVLTLGMGGGGSVLAMAADELREPLREAYREFAEARGYLNSASRLGLCIDVQPARGAEALVPPSAGA